MAENYFPSSVGIGQGGAQVLQGRTPQLSASGIVRGIEQVGKDIREEQAYQKQIELAKAKEKNERLKSLDETITKIQLPDNVAVAQREVNGMWDRINKGEDYETVFQETIGNIERLRKADNFQVQSGKQLEGKRYWDEEKEEYYYAGDLSGEYMDGNIADIQALEEGGINAYVGRIYEKFDPLSKNWYDMASTDMTKLAADFLDEKYKQKGEVNAEEIAFDSGRSGIKVSTSLEEEDLLDAEKELLKSERVKIAYLSSIGFPYKHKTEEGDEEYRKFVKELLADAKDRIIFKNFTSPKDDKGGLNFTFGNGRGENKKFYFQYNQNEIPPQPVEGGKYTPRDAERSIEKVIGVESKGTNPYQDFRTGEGQETIREALVSIRLNENGEPETLILTNEEEVPYKGNEFILDKEYGLTINNIKALQSNQNSTQQDEVSAKDKEAGNKSWSEDDPL